MDAKIDMLHQAGLFRSPQKHLDIVEESEESSEIEDEVSFKCKETDVIHLRHRVQDPSKTPMSRSIQKPADPLRLLTARGRLKYS